MTTNPPNDGRLSEADILDFKAQINREMLPRMRRWAEVLDLLKNKKGYFPQDPQFEMIDTPLEVIIAIRNECLDVLWLTMNIFPEAERKEELDRLAKIPKLREWLQLHKANVARAKDQIAEHYRRGGVA
jgi:hypothetical protein